MSYSKRAKTLSFFGLTRCIKLEKRGVIKVRIPNEWDNISKKTACNDCNKNFDNNQGLGVHGLSRERKTSLRSINKDIYLNWIATVFW